MYCKNCGKEVNEKAIACTSCGLPPLSEKHFCQECGVSTNEKQIICITCGVSLVTQVPQNTNNNSVEVEKEKWYHNDGYLILSLLIWPLFIYGIIMRNKK